MSCYACGAPVPEAAFVVIVVAVVGALAVTLFAGWLIMWLWNGLTNALGWPPMGYAHGLALAWLVRWFTRIR